MTADPIDQLPKLDRVPLEQLSRQVQARHHSLLRLELDRLERQVANLPEQNRAVRAAKLAVCDKLRHFRHKLVEHLDQERETVLLPLGPAPAHSPARGRDAGAPPSDLRFAIEQRRHEHQGLQEMLSDLQFDAAELAAAAAGAEADRLLSDLNQAADTLHQQILAENRALFPRAASQAARSR